MKLPALPDNARITWDNATALLPSLTSISMNTLESIVDFMQDVCGDGVCQVDENSELHQLYAMQQMGGDDFALCTQDCPLLSVCPGMLGANETQDVNTLLVPLFGLSHAAARQPVCLLVAFQCMLCTGKEKENLEWSVHVDHRD